MGLFSICPACGSDWCTGCECIENKLKVALQFIAERCTSRELDFQHPKGYRGYKTKREFLKTLDKDF